MQQYKLGRDVFHTQSSMRTLALLSLFYVKIMLLSICSRSFKNVNTPLSLLGPIVLVLLNNILLCVCHNFCDSCSSCSIRGVLPELFPSREPVLTT